MSGLVLPLAWTAQAVSADKTANIQQQQVKSTMTDYEALTQLVLWERLSKVPKLQQEPTNCYREDATVTTSWTSGSAADYLKTGAAQKNRAESSSNEVILNRGLPSVVHQAGDRAYVELPTDGIHWIKVNGEDAIWTSYMRLIYRCEKCNGVWKITDLTSIFESDKLEPVVAGTNLHINPKDLKGLRPSYRWLAYVRKQAGGEVSNDMLGTDRPEDVEKIYKQDEEWIHAEQ
ncbi:MAG: hypothetical protein SPL73_00620 [Cyanobacteriota bacterium]|nr:hypothetical protein [Cyanobacteriota bacterium]MDY6363373.1 hypothetical protein [Cyanobacteriota bacterium]